MKSIQEPHAVPVRAHLQVHRHLPPPVHRRLRRPRVLGLHRHLLLLPVQVLRVLLLQRLRVRRRRGHRRRRCGEGRRVRPRQRARLRQGGSAHASLRGKDRARGPVPRCNRRLLARRRDGEPSRAPRRHPQLLLKLGVQRQGQVQGPSVGRPRR